MLWQAFLNYSFPGYELFDVNNSVVDLNNCIFWYQQFISWKWI